MENWYWTTSLITIPTNRDILNTASFAQTSSCSNHNIMVHTRNLIPHEHEWMAWYFINLYTALRSIDKIIHFNEQKWYLQRRVKNWLFHSLFVLPFCSVVLAGNWTRAWWAGHSGMAGTRRLFKHLTQGILTTASTYKGNFFSEGNFEEIWRK